ncbi:ABC transporter ATP-binding protein [Streptomyces sp. NPDC051985]|uniref:ABC transporter ATP-binding protein n=1 Tax=Streptomyces sp. NPDC051985 TaxID=3155807 RepID=UPI003438D98C
MKWPSSATRRPVPAASPAPPVDRVPRLPVDVAGESGCGKSTAARALLGLLRPPGRVAAGSVTLAGRDITALPERRLRELRGSEIAFVSQEPMTALDPCYRIGAQLAEVVRRHEPDASRARVGIRVDDLLGMVGLDPEVARRHPHEVSGGMAQRVAIARALAVRRQLLVADEPTTVLDVTVQAEILDLLRDLRTRTGLAILIITHDFCVVADLCERALVMYAGELVEQGPVERLFTAPAHP